MHSARPSDHVVDHKHLDTARTFAELFGQVDDPPITTTATTTATTTQPPNESWQEREASEVGQRLRELYNNFNPTAIRKSSKAHGTFNKHQNNQERFILYLYQNSPEYITQELHQSLDNISAEISTILLSRPGIVDSLVLVARNPSNNKRRTIILIFSAPKYLPF
jgi:hypothetical protein